LHFPIKRGIIEDFAHMENMWEYIFEKELNLDPKNMNILLTDSPLNLKENK
jgi:actin-related protein